jgi:hypothetical protein
MKLKCYRYVIFAGKYYFREPSNTSTASFDSYSTLRRHFGTKRQCNVEIPVVKRNEISTRNWRLPVTEWIKQNIIFCIYKCHAITIRTTSKVLALIHQLLSP